MNIVVKTKFLQDSDIPLLFEDEDVILIEDGVLFPNLLVNLGLYSSTTQARKSGRVGEIQKGWSEIKANKKTKLWIWNPWM